MKTVLLAAIGFYQKAISPLTPASCRFQPSCSEYARQAVGRFGAIRGGGLALGRILRCHPFGGHGYDPVPALSAGLNPPTQEMRQAVAPHTVNSGVGSPSERTQ